MVPFMSVVKTFVDFQTKHRKGTQAVIITMYKEVGKLAAGPNGESRRTNMILNKS